MSEGPLYAFPVRVFCAAGSPPQVPSELLPEPEWQSDAARDLRRSGLRPSIDARQVATLDRCDSRLLRPSIDAHTVTKVSMADWVHSSTFSPACSSESGTLRKVHLSRHKLPGGLVD